MRNFFFSLLFFFFLLSDCLFGFMLFSCFESLILEKKQQKKNDNKTEPVCTVSRRFFFVEKRKRSWLVNIKNKRTVSFRKKVFALNGFARINVSKPNPTLFQSSCLFQYQDQCLGEVSKTNDQYQKKQLDVVSEVVSVTTFSRYHFWGALIQIHLSQSP